MCMQANFFPSLLAAVNDFVAFSVGANLTDSNPSLCEGFAMILGNDDRFEGQEDFSAVILNTAGVVAQAQIFIISCENKLLSQAPLASMSVEVQNTVHGVATPRLGRHVPHQLD